MSVPLSEIHQGLPALRASPHAFWSVGSVTGARPGTLETSAVTLYLVAGRRGRRGAGDDEGCYEAGGDRHRGKTEHEASSHSGFLAGHYGVRCRAV